MFIRLATGIVYLIWDHLEARSVTSVSGKNSIVPIGTLDPLNFLPEFISEKITLPENQITRIKKTTFAPSPASKTLF